MNPVSTDKPNRKTTVVLWIIQGLLALLFLVAGVAKLVMPIAEMTKGTSLPGLFLRFIGVAEVLGAIGLILPGLLRIRRDLTPLAASGLVIIMVRATVVNLEGGQKVAAVITVVAGLLAAFVAYSHWRTAPPRESPSA
jgi:hypothetical protein